jgi:hypothetical protein
MKWVEQRAEHCTTYVYVTCNPMKVFCKLTSHWRVQLVSFRRVRIYTTTLQDVGHDSILGIATRYGLKGSGNRAGGGLDSSPVKTGLRGSFDHLYHGYRFSFPGKKRPESDEEHLSPCSTEIKELVEPYLYSNPSSPRAAMACYGVKFNLSD